MVYRGNYTGPLPLVDWGCIKYGAGEGGVGALCVRQSRGKLTQTAGRRDIYCRCPCLPARGFARLVFFLQKTRAVHSMVSKALVVVVVWYVVRGLVTW